MPPLPTPPQPEPPLAEWEVELEQDAEWLKVRKWREKQLTDAGFSEFTAFRLALVPGLDYPTAIDYLNRGATELQVADLLIPL